MLCAGDPSSNLAWIIFQTHFSQLFPVCFWVFLSIEIAKKWKVYIKSWNVSITCTCPSQQRRVLTDRVSAGLCSLSLWWWPSLSLSHSKPPQEMSIGWGAEKAPWLTFNQAAVMEKTHGNDIALCWKANGNKMDISRNQKTLHLFAWWLLFSCSAFFILTRENTETETLGAIVFLGLNVGQL